MPISFKARCERVRRNNGMTEVFFTRHSNFSGEKKQDEHVLINAHVEPGEFEINKEYIVQITPAFPTKAPSTWEPDPII